jgi:hypothetical protein
MNKQINGQLKDRHWGKAAVRNLSYVQPNMADGDTYKF